MSGRPRRSDAFREHLVPALCLIVFLVVFIALGIAPRHRKDWLLENLPTVVGVGAVVVGYRRFRFSNVAYLLGTLFLLLHTIGSHYTYAEVPLGDWARDAFGWSRNHYDRLVHFSFGVLMLRPIDELVSRRPAQRGRFVELFLGVAVIAFSSLIYEVAEWIVAVLAEPDAAAAFLGMQDDPWDAQKDMLLACVGATLAALGAIAPAPARTDHRAGPTRRAPAIDGATPLTHPEGDHLVLIAMDHERGDHYRATRAASASRYRPSRTARRRYHTPGSSRNRVRFAYSA